MILLILAVVFTFYQSFGEHAEMLINLWVPKDPVDQMIDIFSFWLTEFCSIDDT